MATNFSNMGCDQLLSYAQGGVRDAAKAGCPNAKAKYQAAVYALQGTCGWGEDENANATVRQMLAAADNACHAEAYPSGSSSATSTGGRVVTPVGPSAAAVNTTVPVPAQAGFSPWLLVGGLGLLVLLFGKKKR